MSDEKPDVELEESGPKIEIDHKSQSPIDSGQNKQQLEKADEVQVQEVATDFVDSPANPDSTMSTEPIPEVNEAVEQVQEEPSQPSTEFSNPPEDSSDSSTKEIGSNESLAVKEKSKEPEIEISKNGDEIFEFADRVPNVLKTHEPEKMEIAEDLEEKPVVEADILQKLIEKIPEPEKVEEKEEIVSDVEEFDADEPVKLLTAPEMVEMVAKVDEDQRIEEMKKTEEVGESGDQVKAEETELQAVQELGNGAQIDVTPEITAVEVEELTAETVQESEKPLEESLKKEISSENKALATVEPMDIQLEKPVTPEPLKRALSRPDTPRQRKTSNISFGDVKYFKYESPASSKNSSQDPPEEPAEPPEEPAEPPIDSLQAEPMEADDILDAIVASQDDSKEQENLQEFLDDQPIGDKVEKPEEIEARANSPLEKEYISYSPPEKVLPPKLQMVRQVDLPASRDIDSPAAETPVDLKSKFKFPLYPALKGGRKVSKDKDEALSKDVQMEAKPAEDEKLEVAAIFKMSPKKQVSILVNKPPSDENIPERRRLISKNIPPPMVEPDYNEKTPLIASSSVRSLPTVVGDEISPADPGILEAGLANEPMSSTRSEGGGPTSRRRRRRTRYRSEGIYGPPIKSRPLIASPFMPIPMRKSTIDLDRRSTITREPRPPRPSSYGSLRTQRRAEEVPILPPTASEDESETDSEVSRKISFRTLTSKDWITISMLAVANLCSTIAFSCIAPFYPAEATLKGMTEAETGIVFGIFELMMFITAPIFGKFMTKIGSRNMFTMGLAITGVTAICFGFLNYLPSGRLFFWASLLIRVMEAVGDAAFVTSSFAISAKLFPGNVASIVGIMETFAGLGYTAGPLVGGFLYEYGGFQTPFLVLGGILLVATLLSLFTVESLEDDMDEVDTEKGMMEMLKIPLIWIMSYAVVVCAISLSFLDPTLEAHLRTFSLSPTLVGLMFLLCGGVYTLSAPFWGVLIDKFDCSTFIMFFGSAATAVSMMFIGPSPLIPIDKNLVVIGFALCVLGVAAGALYIPTFQNCLDAVKEYDFDDSIYTYGCVSGIFQSSFAFGGFIGPTLGGAAVQWIGFEWTATAIAAVNLIFIFTLLCYFGGRSVFRRGSVTNSVTA
ncbi:unnamed protein product, partial [Mesorhabditis belari]|uniref:Major facilitator superfamily (MFS) profile domain-containing protein n=1 Tax=Mesorhabditis belari TaxID=2138241 RepID=A0AAF3EGQ9_9BILA